VILQRKHYVRLIWECFVVKVGDLVKDIDGCLGIIVNLQDAYDLYEQLFCPDIFEDSEYPLEYQFVTVYSFCDHSLLIFFDEELEVLSETV